MKEGFDKTFGDMIRKQIEGVVGKYKPTAMGAAKLILEKKYKYTIMDDGSMLYKGKVVGELVDAELKDGHINVKVKMYAMLFLDLSKENTDDN